MDKEQKTLKSPLSAKFCVECKAQVAGEAQKHMAREVLKRIELIEKELFWLKDLLENIIG